MKRTRRRLDPHVIAGVGDKVYSRLRESVVGQDEAVRTVVSAFQRRLSGMAQPGRPVANFLFLGPTGSGKTWLVEQTARVIAGTEEAVLTVDCAEFQESHSLAKLVGAPPGYVGHSDTEPILTQKALDKHVKKSCQLAFVLFDEIEKASDALFNLLLGILSKGRMRTGGNQVVNFEKCMVFMTSNLGAREMERLEKPVGFGSPTAQDIEAKLGQTGTAAARKRFSPEFFNRLDHVVTFQALAEDSLRKILELELRKIQENVFEQLAQSSYVFAVSEDARAQILAQGFNRQYGARHLRRTIDRILVDPLAGMVVAGKVRSGDLVLLDWKEGGFEFYKEFEGLGVDEMLRAVNAIYTKGKPVPKMKDLAPAA
jgi:ATP-dependent Clp protease ATP-binding subunit ClpA